MSTQHSEFNQDQNSYEYQNTQESKAPKSQEENSSSDRPEELPLKDYLKVKGKKLKQKSKAKAKVIKAKSKELSQKIKIEAKRTALELQRLGLEAKHKIEEKHAEWKNKEQERRRNRMHASQNVNPEANDVPYFCPHCGNQVTPGGKFCPSCGSNY
ncbi:MAG: zinc ribbon domain-containing protein [Promethearchaeota archaeon]